MQESELFLRKTSNHDKLNFMEITKRHIFSVLKYLCQSGVGLLLLLATLYGIDKIPHITNPNPLIKIGIVLFIIYTIIEIGENIASSATFYRRKQLYKLCVRLFEAYFVETEEYLNQKDIFRITVFGIRKKFLVFGPKELYHLTRYQHGTSEEKSRICFKPGEGAAGQAYLTNTVIFSASLTDYSQNQVLYIQQSKEKYNLSEEKVRSLNRHARSYICFPMKPFEVDAKPKAIISIDCMLPDMFYENKEFQEKMLPDIIKTIDCSSAEVF